jgi:hypothetical protein
MTEAELFTVLFHESGHATMARWLGHRQRKFELEYGEDLWGDALPDFLPGREELDSDLVLFAGPLAEIRFHGRNRKIDRDRSIPLLLDFAHLGGRFVYFEGSDKPEPIAPAYLGMQTDWNMVPVVYQRGKERDPAFPERDFAERLKVAIDLVNSDVFYQRVSFLAEAMAVQPGVSEIKRGQTLELADARTRPLMSFSPMISPKEKKKDDDGKVNMDENCQTSQRRPQIVALNCVGSSRQFSFNDPVRMYTRGVLPKSNTRNRWNLSAMSSEQRTSLPVT